VTEGSSTGGTDTVFSSVSFALGANLERLTLTGAAAINGTGNALANVINGNGAANTLDGGAGADTLAGGNGDDVYVVDNAGDVVIEAAGGGIDRINATVNLVLPANVENLLLTGTANLRGTGNAGANALTGNAGANVLDGGSGADRIIGGLGTDQLAGCTGADVFVFRSVAESPAGPACDTIVDFETGLDRIDLGAIDACTIGSGGQAFVFIGADPFSGTPGELRYAEGRVAGDVTGDGAADLEIAIANLAALTANDFIL
jgi:Ca2+-binding RTX toxin-like protein